MTRVVDDVRDPLQTNRIIERIFRPEGIEPPWRARASASADGSTYADPVHPRSGYVGVRETLATLLGLDSAGLVDLGRVPQGRVGQKLIALRYFIENSGVWLRHFAWQNGLPPRVTETNGEQSDESLEDKVRGLCTIVDALREGADARGPGWADNLFRSPGPLSGDLLEPESLAALVSLSRHPEARAAVRARLRERARQLYADDPALLDRLYLASIELDRYPATSVSAGQLKYILVADKGEMGVRAVREAVALGKVPVVLHSLADDREALQVRLAIEHGGFAIGLEGSFRETYASFVQMSARIEEVFRERFSAGWQDELGRAALYPGYGPLAENAAAISHFRRSGIVFVGPMQDVVERAGDKRQFRALVEALAPEAVTPGIVLGDRAPEALLAEIREAHALGKIAFPGRIKAANGGGGRGQAIVASEEDLDAALGKVLGAIETNRWEPGVMFEQNIADTVHLEVQVMRDRFGNTRHFGMRDCTEQRASQKIQEEAPPALLRERRELRSWIERTAVEIADSVGYVGAGTIELMYKAGKVYFLEMNTRIQVEHPVTEASHGIRREHGKIEPLNLVAWQMRLADGHPLDFNQDDVVQTHVAREFRINAEAWNPAFKDSRDGKRGLFVPNAGIFDHIDVPSGESVSHALKDVLRSANVSIRFDVGFAEGDVLVNKDPTFGKLIVAVEAADHPEPYEALRLASLAVLEQMRIEGRQVRPDGSVIEGTEFRTNLATHRWILEQEILRGHAHGKEVPGRHVNWVVDALRGVSPPESHNR